jgi:hypothetical protein
MASSSETTRQYPAVCPHCSEEKGFPYQVRTTGRDGVIEVKLRCRDCHHEWVEIVESHD